MYLYEKKNLNLRLSKQKETKKKNKEKSFSILLPLGKIRKGYIILYRPPRMI